MSYIGLGNGGAMGANDSRFTAIVNATRKRGKQAASEGQPITANPHKSRSSRPLQRAWDEGYKSVTEVSA